MNAAMEICTVKPVKPHVNVVEQLSSAVACLIISIVTDAVRSCPQTIHFYLERLATPRLLRNALSLVISWTATN